MAFSLSIVMPVYNEQTTLAAAIERIADVEYPCETELIIVDDGSIDGTAGILARTVDRVGLPIRVLGHHANRGKGAAVRTGVEVARGSHLIILDSDLEYHPADIVQMLQPVLAGTADHVFGARVRGLNTGFRSFRFAIGGRFTTLVVNVVYDAFLTDMHTCLKLVPVSHFRALPLRENGFGLDTEVTVRLLRAGVRPFEVPVSYHGRSVADGKKIAWRDGLRCLWIIAKVRLAPGPPALPAAGADATVLRLIDADTGTGDAEDVIDLAPAEVVIPVVGSGLDAAATPDPAVAQLSAPAV